MRKKLQAINGQRMRFTAVIERFGEKSAFRGYPIPTVLLKHVKIIATGVEVADHLWFTKGKSWAACVVGDTVEFDARVTTYLKGYKGYREDVYDAPIEMDYKLERPTRFIIQERTNTPKTEQLDAQ